MPEPTPLFATLRLISFSLLTSLLALVRVMLPLPAVVTAIESAASTEPLPTCSTAPTAFTERVPLVLILDRSAVPPETIVMAPVSDW